MVTPQIKHLQHLIPLHSSQLGQVVALKVQLSKVRETLGILYAIYTVVVQYYAT